MWFNTQVLKRLCVICIASWAPAVESQAHDFLLCSLREKPALARSLNSHIGQANEILDRLAKVEVFSFNVQPARLTVTDLPVSTAFTRGAREIVISSRLLLSLDDSSELAFVLAHELSHIALGHSRDGQLQDELHADRMALSLLRRAGFDPCAGVAALVRVARPYAASVQGLAERIRSLQHSSSPHCIDLPLLAAPYRFGPAVALPQTSSARLYEASQGIFPRASVLF